MGDGGRAAAGPLRVGHAPVTQVAAQSSRYETLDAWRGIAAIAVLAYHCVNTLVPPDRSWLSDVLWQGWLGVYLFFPISGYCILAASTSAAGSDVGTFLARRWRRIFPTYWASVIVAVGAVLTFAPLSRGSAAVLLEPGAGWVAIVTLTQGLAGMPDAVNPVYWSLCYEEQFYLVIAACLLAPARWRRELLLAVTLLAAVSSVGPIARVLPRGTFVDYWLNFAVGLSVFGWFSQAYGRGWALLQLGAAAVVTFLTGRLDLAVSVAFAVVLLVLRPFDRAIAASAPIGLCSAVGLFSYSLYLTHVPVAGRVINLAKRFGAAGSPWWPAAALVGAAVAIAFAWSFHRLVERRFMNAPSGQSRLAVLAAPVLAES